MGFFSRSSTFTRYAVDGVLPAGFWDFAAERIARHSFRDIDDSDEDFSMGWVSIHNMFDNSFAYASYAAGDYLALSFRVDERKVPPGVLRKFVLKEEERVKKARQVSRLHKEARQEIRKRVHAELIRKVMPSPSVHDLCWNLADGTLMFFASNKKAHELFEGYFRESFGLSLILQVPYVTAAHLLEPAKAARLDDLTPALFV